MRQFGRVSLSLVALLALLALLAPVALGLVLLGARPAQAEPAHAIAMHGEPRHKAGFEHFDYVNPDAPKGGELRRGVQGTFDSFNPFVLRGNPASGIGNLYDTLLTHGRDEPFALYGLLAESIETPPDRSWVEFRLRPEARWHDGTPVTAEDVVWTFNFLTERNEAHRGKVVPHYRFYYGNVTAVKALDDHRVRFEFKPGDNRELPLILGEIPILPKHYWTAEGRDPTKPATTPPLGSGPYRVASFEAGRHVVYERVEDYWGKDLNVNIGLNNFDRLRYDYFRDETVMVEALKSGAFDFRLENSSKHWATAYDIDAVEDGLLVKEMLPDRTPAGMQGYVFNLRRPVFQDPAVRAALTYAFDFEWSNRTLFYGLYKRTRSYFDASELAATGRPQGRELALLEPFRDQLPEQVFTQAYQPPVSDGSGNNRANLREAAIRLRKAGWRVQDGVLTHEETGQPLAFEILLYSPLQERIALPFAKDLKKIGVQAKVRTVDISQYRERLQNFDYDMIVTVWGQSLSPGNEQRDFWTSAAADRPGSRNYAGIRHPAVDALVEKVIAASDRESLIIACRALDRILQWGHYVIPHWHIDAHRVVYWNKLARPETTPLLGPDLMSWWEEPEKAATLDAALGR